MIDPAPPAPAEARSAEDTVRALVQRVWNERRIDELDQFFAPTFDHDGATDTVEGLRAWHRDDAATWEAATYDVLDLVSDGEHVALRWSATATQVGAWGPVPPTGRRVTWRGAHFFTVRDGLVVGMAAMSDMFAKARQLGVEMTPPS